MKKLSLLFLSSVLFMVSCKSDDDVTAEVENDLEAITTVILELDAEDGSHVHLEWEDLEADGDPIITGGTLSAGVAYSASFEILNENAEEEDEEEHDHEEEGDEHDHGYDVTEVIEDEKEEHQFVFAMLNGLDVTITDLDVDANGDDVGLTFTLTAGEASEGELAVKLLHEPTKPATYEETENGEVDFDIAFPITIE